MRTLPLRERIENHKNTHGKRFHFLHGPNGMNVGIQQAQPRYFQVSLVGIHKVTFLSKARELENPFLERLPLSAITVDSHK